MSADYPDAPGAKERTTSLEAALTVAKDILQRRQRVLDAVRAREGSADEIAERLGVSPLSVRPRLSELRKLGLIEPSGRRVRNASGASAHVWRAKTTSPPAVEDLAGAYLKAKGRDE